MVRFFNIAALVLILVLAPNLSSQDTTLRLYGVNEWNFLAADPGSLPYDTVNTGMAILPLEGTDSIQLFQQYGYTTRVGNEWAVGFVWIRDVLTSSQFNRPEYVTLDVLVRSYVNLAYMGIGIVFKDTISHYSGFTWNTVELSPNWQTFSLQTSAMNLVQHIHGITLEFILYGADSTYVGLEILLNNLRFVYANGDTILVDPFQYTFPTSVEPLPGIPTGFILHQNYPNPFNPNTKIRYEISEFSSVNLTIYDLLGQEVEVLINAEQPAGIYEADFDASHLSSGTYIYVLRTKDVVLKKKMILMK